MHPFHLYQEKPADPNPPACKCTEEKGAQTTSKNKVDLSEGFRKPLPDDEALYSHEHMPFRRFFLSNQTPFEAHKRHF